jgi:hypothetical protein
VVAHTMGDAGEPEHFTSCTVVIGGCLELFYFVTLEEFFACGVAFHSGMFFVIHLLNFI